MACPDEQSNQWVFVVTVANYEVNDMQKDGFIIISSRPSGPRRFERELPFFLRPMLENMCRLPFASAT
ncbi:MAG: hypothetical protein QOF48_3266 [Verrucomicrobiota bacterium]|jgi:hypothetical protein